MLKPVRTFYNVLKHVRTLSSNLYLLSRYNVHFCELIPTGNTILKRKQWDVCAMTLEMPEIDYKGQSATYVFLSTHRLLFPGATIR